MKVCFTGDVFLGGDATGHRLSAQIASDTFQTSDLRVINLEQPISDVDGEADKCTLHTGSEVLHSLVSGRIDVATLANNHIHDKGIDAIQETVKHLESVGIRSTGAGCDLATATTPIWLTSDVAVFAYCDYGRPTLQNVAVASKSHPGVAPLRFAQIESDLRELEDAQRAVLVFHWGREHVWFPPLRDIQLARCLLAHPKVALIIGMHAHRPQGIVSYRGKRAYMCVGNFLFPNFYIDPPTKIATQPDDYQGEPITRTYHSVFTRTYKKWLSQNRSSILVQYDTERRTCEHFFCRQDDDSPQVAERAGMQTTYLHARTHFLSLTYRLPTQLYRILEMINRISMQIWWGSTIFYRHSQQLGTARCFTRMVKHYLRKGVRQTCNTIEKIRN